MRSLQDGQTPARRFSRQSSSEKEKHCSHDKLFIFRNFSIDIGIPPLDPLFQGRPLRVDRQVVPNFVDVIKEARNTPHGIAYDDEYPGDFIVEIHEYAIALRIVRFHRDHIRSETVVVPIVSGDETGQGLDEIPRHASSASGVGGSICDFGSWLRLLGPCDFASAVGEGVGETTMTMTMTAAAV